MQVYWDAPWFQEDLDSTEILKEPNNHNKHSTHRRRNNEYPLLFNHCCIRWLDNH